MTESEPRRLVTGCWASGSARRRAARPRPAHVRSSRDARTGRPATRKTPRRFVELRTFVDLPPLRELGSDGGLPRLPEPETPPDSRAYSLAPSSAPASARDGLRVLRDPETPPEQSISPCAPVNPVLQVVWYVDGALPGGGLPLHREVEARCGEHVPSALIDGRTPERRPRARAVEGTSHIGAQGPAGPAAVPLKLDLPACLAS
jgi:hypothetical protein